MRAAAPSALELAGLGAILWGLVEVYPPAAGIVAGLGAILLAHGLRR